MYANSIMPHKQLWYGLFFVSFLGTLFVVAQASANNASQIPESSTSLQTRSLSLTMGDQTEIISEEHLKEWFTIETRLGIDTQHQAEIEDTRLCPLDAIFCDFILSQHMRASLHSHAVLTPNKEAIQTYVTALNTKISKPSVDAKFTVIDNKIEAFSLSQDGTELDIDTSVSLILAALTDETRTQSSTIILPVIALKPAIQSSDAGKFGITELIGEGRTNFAGSPKNRIHNFTRALEQFNGVMLAPQEEFSFVKFLGDVDGEHGYLPELVIKQNKTEPEFGGGICQVSSTVFRAAIYSGLKITARRNHAYPVSYYKPYGMDATIYVPKPDLQFVNNTPGHILMQTFIEGSQLIFRFYGTSDGRKTEIDGPHILEHNPDGSMKTIFTQKVTTADGTTLINDDFRSNYASPSKYPHPGQDVNFTEKPSDWSQNQWSDYKKTHSPH